MHISMKGLSNSQPDVITGSAFDICGNVAGKELKFCMSRTMYGLPFTEKKRLKRRSKLLEKSRMWGPGKQLPWAKKSMQVDNEDEKHCTPHKTVHMGFHHLPPYSLRKSQSLFFEVGNQRMFFILERVNTGGKMGLDRSQAYSIKMCLIGKRLSY